MAAQMGVSLFTATVALGQSLSAQVDLGPYVLTGIHMPPAWTAASVTFQASPDNGATWNNIFGAAGTEQTLTAAAGQYIALDPALWRGVVSLKVRSGPSGAPVPQGADAPLTLVGKLL